MKQVFTIACVSSSKTNNPKSRDPGLWYREIEFQPETPEFHISTGSNPDCPLLNPLPTATVAIWEEVVEPLLPHG